MDTQTTDMDQIQMVLDAIKFRVWVHGTYEAETRKGQPDGPISRSVLPFRMFETQDGALCFEGFDTFRNCVRTFRLDRWINGLARGDEFHGEKDPCIAYTRKGTEVVWPVAHHLYRARPQTVTENAVDRFLSAGWSLIPPTFVVPFSAEV